MSAGPHGTVASIGAGIGAGILAGRPHGLLAGTVTPDQVRRGLALSMPREAVEVALSAAIKHRAAGGRELRAAIAVIGEGFNVAHPLLATRIVPAARRDAARSRKDWSHTHPAPTSSRHGIAMAVIATGRTHVAEAIVLQGVTLDKQPFDILRVIKRAAEEASIVNKSSTSFTAEPQHQAALSDEIVVALRKNKSSLLVLPSGNYEAKEPAAQSEANLRVLRERSVLTVGGYHEPTPVCV